MDFLKPYLWRLVLSSLGFVTAISFMVMGFWRTTLILLCCGVGYIIGVCKDKNISIPERFFFWKNKW